ncbi:hypothetical protein [Mycobacteroides chelonae]|uniref:hypothetical protein n=1 Tax=Mycobacteroides chelonae TaxID=1774 RepID=UPI0012FFA377|nr:hypothetical protein [Mycobacteroides chelonae]
MCPPPRISVAQILVDACVEAARKHPELWFPDRYYTVADRLDWSGREPSAH